MNFKSIMKRLFHSFVYAFNGIYLVFTTERNMQIHSLFALCVILLSSLLQISNLEWCVILLCIMIVCTLEVINTVIEKYLDFYHPERSEKVKILKDMSAGAVLLTAIISVIIGIIIFLPKIHSYTISLLNL